MLLCLVLQDVMLHRPILEYLMLILGKVFGRRERNIIDKKYGGGNGKKQLDIDGSNTKIKNEFEKRDFK